MAADHGISKSPLIRSERKLYIMESFAEKQNLKEAISALSLLYCNVDVFLDIELFQSNALFKQ